MQVTITDRGDLTKFVRAIRREANGPALRKEMSRALRAEVKPVVAAVRANYAGGTHLRPLLAKATRSEVRLAGKQAGVRVRVDGRRMPSGMRSLPRYWEGNPDTAGRGRWRHPVWGDRNVWVQQPSHPTFEATTARFTPRIRARIDEIATDVARRIESR